MCRIEFERSLAVILFSALLTDCIIQPSIDMSKKMARVGALDDG